MGEWTAYKNAYPPLGPDAKYGAKVLQEALTHKGAPLEQIADTLSTAKDRVASLEKELYEANLHVLGAELAILHRLEDKGLESVKVGGYHLTPSPQPYPVIKDRSALLGWANDTMPDALSLNFNTLKSALKDALKNGEAIPPGVDVFIKTSLSRKKAAS